MARTSGKLRLGAAALLAGMTLLLAGAWALRDASASSPTPLLPDLVADAPDGQQLVLSSQSGGATRLLLRFNGYIHNAGPGALDISGSREAPHVQGKNQRELEMEVQVYKQRKESLPAALEAELAFPAMNVSQRLFTTNEGNSQQTGSYLERPHVDQPSSAQLLYSSADGHHHWHLQRIVSYSLWNADRTAAIAPSQKVGFCLEDVEHVDPGVGPGGPVYRAAGPPEIRFCRQFEPNATGVHEGISPGWRDVYESSLAFQWVDVSDVAPGEYWLREDVDPTGVVAQTDGGSKSQFAKTPSIVPGFVAQSQSASTGEGEALPLTLAAHGYADSAQPQFAVVSGPSHGILHELGGGHVQYVPDAGYSGSDSFSFAARDPGSQFPEHPPTAAVQIEIASHRPALAISGAQSQIVAGSTMALSATVGNDEGGVEWSASSGSVSPVGDDLHELYTAPAVPPAGGAATVTARLKDDPAVFATVTVGVTPAAPSEPAPEPPSTSRLGAAGGSGSSTGTSSARGDSPQSGSAGFVSHKPALSRPRAMLFGRMLVMTTVPSAAGRVRLTAHLAHNTIGTCAAQAPAGRTFTCRVRLPHRVSTRAHISIRATLRAGQALAQAVLPAQRIPEMKMVSAGAASGSMVFWCEPGGRAARPRRTSSTHG